MPIRALTWRAASYMPLGLAKDIKHVQLKGRDVSERPVCAPDAMDHRRTKRR